MSRSVLALLILVLSAITVRDADACSCIQRSPCQLFAGADAVFVGEITAVNDGTREKVATVRVTHVYKGAAKLGATVPVSLPPGSSASCSLDVAPGQRRVIYAGSGDDGRFSTGLCSGGYMLDAGTSLPVLPPPAGDVTGRLLRFTRGDRGPDAIPDVPVWVQTPAGRIASRTGEDGAFALSRVPPGRWTVAFDLGPSETADRPIELGADDCEFIIASPRPSGRITGSVVDAAGRPIEDARVYAIPSGAEERRWERSAETDAAGAYTLQGLQAGRYLVVVGLLDAPSARFPYQPLFHPATTDRGAAVAVCVGGPEPVRLPPIAMGAPLPLVPVSAEIVCRDGTRPSSAFVTARRLGHDQPLVPMDYSSGTAEGGRYVVRVLSGHRFAIAGEVVTYVRTPDGMRGQTTQRTAALEIDSARPQTTLRLMSDLERCDRPGGVVIDQPR